MKQTYRFLFIMDPLETLNLATETSLLFMEDLIARGHEVLWTQVDDLMLRQNRLHAHTRSVTGVSPIAFGTTHELAVDNVDAIFVRPDPPFDSSYLHLTYLLDFVDNRVLQLNAPAALRNFNEKLSTLHFADLAPDTLTTRNHAALMDFLQHHGTIVIKPLDDCSGRGLARVSVSMGDATEQVRALLKGADGKPRFVTAQEFLPEISLGDKRVYMAGGEPVGIVNRIPVEGGWLGNIHQGARCAATELTAQENAILERLKPFLEDNGILLAGLDLIGGKLTEINITSPSALRQINEVTGLAVHKMVIDHILQKLGTT